MDKVFDEVRKANAALVVRINIPLFFKEATNFMLCLTQVLAGCLRRHGENWLWEPVRQVSVFLSVLLLAPFSPMLNTSSI